MAQKVKIIDTREFPSTEPARVGKMDVIVTYQLDAFRTYLVTIPKEQFTEPAIIAAIKKDMAEREKWAGKEFEV